MQVRTLALWGLFCAALLLFSASVQAQAAADSTHAFEAYGRGQLLFREQRYAEAQAAFEEAYKTVANPVVLLGVAEAQQRQSLWAEAVLTLTRYLREAPNAQDREKVEQEIAAIQAALAPVVETVKVPVAPITSPVMIMLSNEMSSSYRLVKVVLAIDGTPVLTRSAEKGELGAPSKLEVPSVALTPGKHTLTINLEYKSSTFGVFSYLDGYRFNLRSSHGFSTQPDRALQLRVVAYERGGPTLSLGERPAVRYTEKVMRALPGDRTAESL